MKQSDLHELGQQVIGILNTLANKGKLNNYSLEHQSTGNKHGSVLCGHLFSSDRVRSIQFALTLDKDDDITLSVQYGYDDGQYYKNNEFTHTFNDNSQLETCLGDKKFVKTQVKKAIKRVESIGVENAIKRQSLNLT